MEIFRCFKKNEAGTDSRKCGTSEQINVLTNLMSLLMKGSDTIGMCCTTS